MILGSRIYAGYFEYSGHCIIWDIRPHASTFNGFIVGGIKGDLECGIKE